MKKFHFTKKYFNKKIFEDSSAKIRVVITEKPSLNLSDEEYSLRITTRHENLKIIHRNYAIEHHLPPSEHTFPHLQFKFHTENIGQFRIRINVKNHVKIYDFNACHEVSENLTQNLQNNNKKIKASGEICNVSTRNHVKIYDFNACHEVSENLTQNLQNNNKKIKASGEI